MDAEVRRFQLRLGIHDHHRGNDVDAGFAGRLPDDRAEMCLRYAKLFGIPRNVSLRGIVLHNQPVEVFAGLFGFGQIGIVFDFIFI